MSNLLAKLGYRPGVEALCFNVPEDLKAILAAISLSQGEKVSWLIAFAMDKKTMESVASDFVPKYRRGGHLWICYPKLTGSIHSDLTRDKGWDSIAAQDLLGVTQVALDKNWSALRFRYRDEIRKITRKKG